MTPSRNKTYYVNLLDHAIDLADGRVVAPGERAELDSGADHNKALLNSGALSLLTPKEDS